ncbi:penicillin-binding protein 2, partial [bacterium]|nr:penicillin-binding protein 2 [bacterium]
GIANSGVVYTPHLFKRVETYSGRTIGTARSTVAYRMPYGHGTMSFLQEAMLGVVEAPNGTGKLARVEGMQVAGKTGTAQNPHGEDHACFIAYAPADEPAIALAVIIENAGGGGAIAAPIARQVMKAYFRIEDQPDEPPYRPPDEQTGGNGDGGAASENGAERGGGETGGGSHAEP